MEDLRYPIGRYEPADSFSLDRIKEQVTEIKVLPENLREIVIPLSEQQLDTPYRPEGWTVRQLAHHIADSHMNSYIRMKWALTEDESTIKPYDEKLWAELPDSEAPVQISLNLIENLHNRWGYLLDSLESEQLLREYRHPESGMQTLWRHIDHYAWHGQHHLAHIRALIKRKNWN